MGDTDGNQPDTAVQSWPWLVVLESPVEDIWQRHCLGTLISSFWVLTAAHCVYVKHNFNLNFQTVMTECLIMLCFNASE